MSRVYTLNSLVQRSWTVTEAHCDGCGKPLGTMACSPNSPIDEVKIAHRREVGSIAGGSYTHTTVDLCERCFTERLLPLLQREMGITAQVKTISYDES